VGRGRKEKEKRPGFCLFYRIIPVMYEYLWKFVPELGR